MDNKKENRTCKIALMDLCPNGYIQSKPIEIFGMDLDIDFKITVKGIAHYRDILLRYKALSNSRFALIIEVIGEQRFINAFVAYF
jgi:hypothetical protein